MLTKALTDYFRLKRCKRKYENEKDFLMKVISVATDGLYDGCVITHETNKEADYDTGRTTIGNSRLLG